MFLPLTPQILILSVAMALSATGGWKATSLYYQAEIAGMRLDKAKAVARAEKLNHSLSEAGLALSAAISERDAARLREIDIVEREVFVNVYKYRSLPPVMPVDGVCRLDPEWVRWHDRATGSGVSEATSGTGSVDEGAAYADALEAVTTNYATCNKLRVQVIGWQEFYEGVRRLHEH
jgi:hypothetical protein